MPACIHHHIRPIAGFTLVELLIVTMVISVLAIVASPTLSVYLEQARVARGISIARVVQASLASYTTTNVSYQYPASISSYGELTVLANTHSGKLKNTQAEAGMELRQYTALDTDGDSVWDSYTMSFRVTNVSPKRSGWCIRIRPSGVERCPPQ
jgi:prepilin-type N-terminal cleavage/methylation domain-containing protein